MGRWLTVRCDARPWLHLAVLVAALAASPCSLAVELLGPAPSRYPVGSSPADLAVGDLDASGTGDLAVADSDGDAVHLLFGDGRGGLDSLTVAVPGRPVSVVSADFDRDGRSDVAVGCASTGAVHVLLAPAFDPIAAATFEAGPMRLATGDFDADGSVDLAVARSEASSVGVLLGDGRGGFVRGVDVAVGRRPESIVTGDLDADGASDLVVAPRGNRFVSVLRADGAGGFARLDLAVDHNPSVVVVADLNGDGVQDVAAAGSRLSVLLGSGSGFVSRREVTLPGIPDDLALGDVDVDGIPDLVAVRKADRSLRVLRGDGTGGFVLAASILAGGVAVVASDLDGDGATDLGVAEEATHSVAVLFGDGAGGLTTAAGVRIGHDPEALVSADLDGDGAVDLAAASASDHGVDLLLGDGGGGFSLGPRIGVGQSPRALVGGDFDRDGRADLAVAAAAGDVVSVLRRGGTGGLVRAADIDVGRVPVAIAAADFDRDGDVDLVVAHREGGSLRVLAGDEAGGFEQRGERIVVGDPVALAAGDVDRDGLPDLVVADRAAGRLILLRGDGALGFDRRPDELEVPDPTAVAVHDLDGDGVLDIAATSYARDSVWLFGADGPTELPTGRGPSAIVASDVNRDGSPDLIVADRTSGTVSLVIAAQQGGYTLEPGIAVGREPVALAAGDFDADGLPDIAVADRADDAVVVLSNQLLDRADINGSRRIDGFDVAAVGVAFGCTPDETCYSRSADVDRNGRVDGDDLAWVASRFGGSRVRSILEADLAPVVPAEPGTVSFQPGASDGDVLRVQVIANVTSDRVTGARFAVAFDPEIVEFERAAEGSYLEGGAARLVMSAELVEPGLLEITLARLPNTPTAASGPEPLVDLAFRGRAPGSTALSFAAARGGPPALLDVAGAPLPGTIFAADADVLIRGPLRVTSTSAAIAPGTVTLQPAPSLSTEHVTFEVVADTLGRAAARADFGVRFDPGVLDPVAVDAGPYFATSGTPDLSTDDTTPGLIGISVATRPPEDVVGPRAGVVSGLAFRARATGETLLEFDPGSELRDTEGSPVDGVTFAGSLLVTVEDVTPPDGRLVPSPAVVDFGEVGVGESARRKLRLSNVGASDVRVTAVTSSLDAFRPQVQADFNVRAFGFVELWVEFSPARDGSFTGDLLVAHEAAGGVARRVEVSLAGRSGSVLAVVPERLEFGSVAVGTERTRSVRVANRGGATLVVRSIETSDPGFEATASFPVLAPDATGVVEVRFAPDAVVEFRGRLTLGFDDPAGPTAVVALGGGGSMDDDADGASDLADNCPGTANPTQADTDGDGVGDACDDCPDTPDPEQDDLDGDTVGDACDNCPAVANPDQLDSERAAFAAERTIGGLSNSTIVGADVDGDGDTDILGAGSRIVWYENLDSVGTFGPPRAIASQSSNVLLAADLDGDTDLDIAGTFLGSSGGRTIVWHENLDAGRSFGPARVISTAVDGLLSLEAADLDGDSDLDVLSGSGNDDKIAWYENLDGLGSFGSQRMISTAADSPKVVAADLDGDGDTDALSVSSNERNIAWYENVDGRGRFAPQRVISTESLYPNSVVAVDLDSDGDVDILSSAQFGGVGEVAWYENLDGAGSFGVRRMIASTASVHSVFTADVDRDSDPDVLWNASRDGKIAWHENLDGAGSFGPERLIAFGEGRLDTKAIAADIDGDGDDDVVSTDAELLWHENRGEAGFGPLHVVAAPTRLPFSTLAVDLDGDEDIDVVSGFAGGTSWHENSDGAGTFGSSHSIDRALGPRTVAGADLDGDGDVDLLSSSDQGVLLYWNRDGAGGFGAAEVVFHSSYVQQVAIADLDGDGDPDTLSWLTEGSRPGIVWHENWNGAGDFASPTLVGFGGYPSGTSLATADMDGDGDIDVLPGAEFEGEVLLWFENQDGTGRVWAPRAIAAVQGGAASYYTAADLDGDSDLDVLSASGDQRVVWYENLDGIGTFGPGRVVSAAATSFSSVGAADLDGDGDLDVLVRSAIGVAWHENLDGAGSFGPQQLVATSANGPPRAVDMDGDDDLDVLVGLSWYENAGDGAGDACDNCPGLPDLDQQDTDRDGTGDSCDDCTDTDGDGFGDPAFLRGTCAIDRCPRIPHPDQTDSDGPGGFAPRIVDRDSPDLSTDFLQGVVATDIDRDGDLDILSGRTEIAWYENVNGAGMFGAPRAFAPGSGSSPALAAADLDGDGDADVITAGHWYENVDGRGTFEPRSRISASARAALTADLDLDGDPDVVVMTGSLVWYENLDGAGTLGPQRLIRLGIGVFARIFSADLDGDSDTDLLSAVQTNNPAALELTWYENLDAAGNFGPQRSISRASIDYWTVSAADMDGDSDIDVLSASLDNNSTAWYENLDGAGTFGPPRVIAVTQDVARSVIVSDIDGDGDGDTVVGTEGGLIAWYENLDGAGAFGPPRTLVPDGPVIWSVAAADIDGDSDLDILAASESGITWYEQGADGVGRVCDNCPAAHNGDQADADDDGIGDACDPCTDADGDGSGDPGFPASTCPLDSCPDLADAGGVDSDDDGVGDACDNCPGVLNAGQADADADGVGDRCDDCPVVSDPDQADVDGDGYGNLCDGCVDLAATTQSDRDRDGIGDACDPCTDIDGDGLGEPGFPASNCPSDNCREPNPDQADADVDGVADACDNCPSIGNPDQADAGEGPQAFRRRTITVTAESARSVLGADVDGDGDEDVVSASSGDDEIAWYENVDGAGQFGPENTITTHADGASVVLVADLDGDGDADVLSGSEVDSEVAWYENLDGRGTVGPQRLLSSVALGAHGLYAADLDGDSDLDVLAASFVGDTIAWYENLDGAGSFSRELFLSRAADGASAVFAVDFDGDSDLDVLASSQLDDTIAWYENLDGAGSFGSGTVITTASNRVHWIVAADLDGDGDPDVLAAAHEADRVLWYENLDGQGMFGPSRVVSADAGGAESVFAADVDRDGDIDALSASAEDDEIAWHENLDGRGTFGPERVISATAAGAESVFATDIDGDGDLDVLAASTDDGTIAWHENGGDGIGDACDNCPDASNRDQQDADGDGLGDRCDGYRDPLDADGDGVDDVRDNCVAEYDHMQSDGDADGVGDVCDNCPAAANTDQRDVVHPNGVGDACDDPDGDGVPDRVENCPDVPNTSQLDSDQDARGDACDNCPAVSNTSQVDEDSDGVGNLCDSCPHVPNTDQADSDADGVGDPCDRCPTDSDSGQADADGDGAGDVCDNCPARVNADQADSDADGIGDVCDNCPDAPNADQADSDADTVGDVCDACPNDPRADFDRDGICGDADNCPSRANADQADSDGDAVGDVCDNCPAAANPGQENTDGGSFLADHPVSSGADGARSVAAADLSGDGRIDLVAASQNAGEIAWYERDVANGPWTKRTITVDAPGVLSVAAADLDGDGDVDIASASIDSDTLAWHENLDGLGRFGAARTISGFVSDPISVFVSDIDDDGDTDVLSASFADNKIAWYENLDGAGTFGPQRPIDTLASGAYAVSAADLDGNGDPDVLSASFLSNRVAWYSNLDGLGEFGSPRVISAMTPGPVALSVADLDGDADRDVLTAAIVSGEVGWHENVGGAGTFGPRRVITSGAAGVQAVVAADLDGDGDLDVASASSQDDTIAWHENLDGFGSFGPRRVVTSTADGAASVVATDIDGDGDSDLASAAPSGDTIAWHESTGDGLGDACDNCPGVGNSDQTDTDGDGLGDACETP